MHDTSHGREPWTFFDRRKFCLSQLVFYVVVTTSISVHNTAQAEIGGGEVSITLSTPDIQIENLVLGGTLNQQFRLLEVVGNGTIQSGAVYNLGGSATLRGGTWSGGIKTFNGARIESTITKLHSR